MTKDEVLKLALEALRQIDEAMPFPVAKLAQKAIKEALAQPEPWEKFCDSSCVWTDHHPDCKLAKQEPVAWRAWVSKFPQGTGSDWVYVTKPIMKDKIHNQPLYTTPPQRKSLTDERIWHLVDIHVSVPCPSHPLDNCDWVNFARAIEAAHGIKE